MRFRLREQAVLKPVGHKAPSRFAAGAVVEMPPGFRPALSFIPLDNEARIAKFHSIAKLWAMSGHGPKSEIRALARSLGAGDVGNAVEAFTFVEEWVEQQAGPNARPAAHSTVLGAG